MIDHTHAIPFVIGLADVSGLPLATTINRRLEEALVSEFANDKIYHGKRSMTQTVIVCRRLHSFSVAVKADYQSGTPWTHVIKSELSARIIPPHTVKSIVGNSSR